MKGFALRLVLKQRHKRTWKWPIAIGFGFSSDWMKNFVRQWIVQHSTVESLVVRVDPVTNGPEKCGRIWVVVVENDWLSFCLGQSKVAVKTMWPIGNSVTIRQASTVLQNQSIVRQNMATATFTYKALRKKTLEERIKTQRVPSIIRGTQRTNWAKNPLRGISRLHVMFKDCLKSCFDQLEKFDLFGFLSWKL